MSNITELKIIIRGLLVSTQKCLTIQQLNKDYRKVEGRDIPLLGHADLQSLLSSMPDTVRLQSNRDNFGRFSMFVNLVVSEKIAHLDRLVLIQRPNQRMTGPARRPAIETDMRSNGHASRFSSLGPPDRNVTRLRPDLSMPPLSRPDSSMPPPSRPDFSMPPLSRPDYFMPPPSRPSTNPYSHIGRSLTRRSPTNRFESNPNTRSFESSPQRRSLNPSPYRNSFYPSPSRSQDPSPNGENIPANTAAPRMVPPPIVKATVQTASNVEKTSEPRTIPVNITSFKPTAGTPLTVNPKDIPVKQSGDPISARPRMPLKEKAGGSGTSDLGGATAQRQAAKTAAESAAKTLYKAAEAAANSAAAPSSYLRAFPGRNATDDKKRHSQSPSRAAVSLQSRQDVLSNSQPSVSCNLGETSKEPSLPKKVPTPLP